MGNLITIVHPAHGIIGDILTVILCIPVAALFLFTFLWPLYSAIRDWFGVAEQVPLMPEKSILQSLPMGAPRDGGAYILEKDGWKRLSAEEHEAILAEMKCHERETLNPEGWEVLAPETEPVAHPDRLLEITNEGPDDADEEEEVERPDERMVFVSE